MPCYSPLRGYRSRVANASGKRSITFRPSQGFVDQPVEVPCGQCIGCRLERSRQWAIRCMHEASLYQDNCFLTLTYNDEHLPKDGSLDVRHFQLFMKRLRDEFGPGIRYFHCGEYGERFQRPHYHACIFNFDFQDKVLWSVRDGFSLYRSPALERIWGLGFCSIGDVTFESAAYVARYITKKVTGESGVHHYNEIDYVTGEILVERKPEYTTMSRRPGIGRGWFDKFGDDVFPRDSVILRGKEVKPPKYYDSIFDAAEPERFARVKGRRKSSAKERSDDNSFNRLRVKERNKKRKLKFLKRGFEDDL